MKNSITKSKRNHYLRNRNIHCASVKYLLLKIGTGGIRFPLWHMSLWHVFVCDNALCIRRHHIALETKSWIQMSRHDAHIPLNILIHSHASWTCPIQSEAPPSSKHKEPLPYLTWRKQTRMSSSTHHFQCLYSLRWEVQEGDVVNQPPYQCSSSITKATMFSQRKSGTFF
jgi:hypothetical protein